MSCVNTKERVAANGIVKRTEIRAYQYNTEIKYLRQIDFYDYNQVFVQIILKINCTKFYYIKESYNKPAIIHGFAWAKDKIGPKKSTLSSSVYCSVTAEYCSVTKFYVLDGLSSIENLKLVKVSTPSLSTVKK